MIVAVGGKVHFLQVDHPALEIYVPKKEHVISAFRVCPENQSTTQPESHEKFWLTFGRKQVISTGKHHPLSIYVR